MSAKRSGRFRQALGCVSPNLAVTRILIPGNGSGIILDSPSRRRVVKLNLTVIGKMQAFPVSPILSKSVGCADVRRRINRDRCASLRSTSYGS
jgi:hypothetical protein